MPSGVFEDEDDDFLLDANDYVDADDDKMGSDSEDKAKSQTKTAKPLLSDDEDAGRIYTWAGVSSVYKIAFVPSKDSNQPAHLCSLTRGQLCGSKASSGVGWSESSRGTHAILSEMLCPNSVFKKPIDTLFYCFI